MPGPAAPPYRGGCQFRHGPTLQQAPRAANASGRGDGNHTARLGPPAHPGVGVTSLGVTNVPPLGGGPPCPLLPVMEETKTRQSLSMYMDTSHPPVELVPDLP